MTYREFKVGGRKIRLETTKTGLPTSVPGIKQPEESSDLNLFCDEIYVGEIDKSPDIKTLKREAKDLLEEHGYM